MLNIKGGDRIWHIIAVQNNMKMLLEKDLQKIVHVYIEPEA